MSDQVAYDIRPGVNSVLIKPNKKGETISESGIVIPESVDDGTGVSEGTIFRAPKGYIDSHGNKCVNPWFEGQLVFYRSGAGMFSAPIIKVGAEKLTCVKIEEVIAGFYQINPETEDLVPHTPFIDD